MEKNVIKNYKNTGLNGEYKCTKNFISLHCRFKENGRCKHYYDIERARDELEEIEYKEHEDKLSFSFKRGWIKRILLELRFRIRL